MDEFSLINSIKQSYYRQPGLLKGIGDDAAVFRVTQGDLVIATDVFVEEVHFSRKTMTPDQVGYRALAVNLSDIAAMGGIPLYYLVSIVVSPSWKKDINKLYDGMQALAKNYAMDLIGGDTVSGNQLTITITILGKVLKNKAKYRSLAKPGDIVFVTGNLGDSRAGLHILQTKNTYDRADYFIRRHRYPEPRITFSKHLQAIDRIALNDVSDGIISEASEIAFASDVALVIDESKLPISDGFKQFERSLQLEWKLFGGEDFELLGTTSPIHWNEIKEIGKQTNTKVTKVGYVQEKKSFKEKGEVYLIKDGKKTFISKRGYTHLT